MWSILSGVAATVPYDVEVLRAVRRIPPARVMSYGDVAEYIGAGGPRQVAAVMSAGTGDAPWWRVLRADGSAAPAVGDEQLARLRAEGTPMRADGRVDMRRARWDGRPDRTPRRSTVERMPSRRVRVPATSYDVHRATLDNGLRVVLAPDRAAPVVAVAVYYDVGIRSEPEGRTGFAHLFEHLMFQGSASLQKMEHVKFVQSSGGTLNGSTRLDYTNYFEALPTHALERALFLEADRMRSPRVTEENLANQIAVVKEEIRVNVLNQPYGGFPWLTLPPVLFETFPNAHNGYGGFEDLESASVDDARDFFDRYYAPGNAVLAVGGDLDPDEALRLVERHFGDVPARDVPPRPDFDEPAPDGERRAEQPDALAPAPALALGWRVPDPADLDTYLPYVVLSSALTTGDASRLRRRLVQQDRVVTDVGSHVGLMEDPFDVRNPTAFVVEAHHSGDVAGDRVVAAIDEELDRLATDGMAAGELDRVVARLSSAVVQGQDHVLTRTLAMAVFEQQRDRAELVGELPALLGRVGAEEVAKAAADLRGGGRARLDVVAGGR